MPDGLRTRHGTEWRTRAADLEVETLASECTQDTPDPNGKPRQERGLDVDAFWPPVPGGSWPPGFTVGREQIYDDTGRLTPGGRRTIPETIANSGLAS